MPLRGKRTNGTPLAEPPAAPPIVSVAHNTDAKQVAMIFGDPASPNPLYVTFTPDQARGIGHAMIEEADKAEGRSLPGVHTNATTDGDPDRFYPRRKPS